MVSPLLMAHPSFPCRTFHTSLSSPVALAPAHLAHPTLPAARTGMGVTPVGSVASAPAGQSSSDPLHCPFPTGGRGRGGQEGSGTLGECEVDTLSPSGGCLEYREQHRSESKASGGGGAAGWMPRPTGKLRLALVHSFSSFVPCFHKRRVRSEYLADSVHLHHQAVCPHSWPPAFQHGLLALLVILALYQPCPCFHC